MFKPGPCEKLWLRLRRERGIVQPQLQSHHDTRTDDFLFVIHDSVLPWHSRLYLRAYLHTLTPAGCGM